MSRDLSHLSLLAPLVLRLALAAIFIYHGLGKILPAENGLGTSWAAQRWGGQLKAPKDVLLKLDQLTPEEEEDPEAMAEFMAELKARLTILYAKEAGPVPTSLRFAATQLAVAWGELVAGVALLVGMFTRLAALALILIQIGAIATVTWAKGFSFVGGGGYEYNLALIAMCLALILLGSGALSIDRWSSARRASAPASRKEVSTPAGAA